MLSGIRKRLTYANVAATLALVFAMSGSALAAGHYLITSTKQIKPSVVASLKGKAGTSGTPGTQGSQGPAGAAGKEGSGGKEGPAGKEGPEGKEGKAGTNGTNGKPGKSVVVATEPEGANCEKGGSSLEVEGSSTKHYVCNGKEGAAGPEGNIKATLPSGSTETGTWELPQGAEGLKRVLPISFPIPLAKPLEASGCFASEPKCHFYLVAKGTTGTGGCEGGTAEVPSAKPGNLCLYVGSSTNIDETQGVFITEEPGKEGSGDVGTTGLFLRLVIKGENEGEEGEARGTWAVSAE